MSALAKYALSLGKRVGGSDRNGSACAEVKACGARIYDDSQSLLRYEVVVYTDAVGENNAELKLARSAGKIVIPRGRFLYEVSRNFARVVAVSGCHGKTTTTAMLAGIFYSAGKKFTAHIGGNSLDFSSFCSFGSDYFITEACEYKKNFMYLRPDTAVVLSTEPDHVECYKEGELEECYKKFVRRSESAVVPAGDGLFSGSGAITFGRGGDVYAENVRQQGGKYAFSLCAFGKNCGEICLKVIGGHNVADAVAAAAAALSEGVEFADIKRGLESFSGVERRMQYLGKLHGARCVADYAHHPTEIAAALRTAEKISSGRLYVVFQPHTYSRTKNLFGEFVSVLSGVRRLMVYRTFAAREYFDDAGSALTLSQAVKKCRYGDSPADILRFLRGAGEGDTALFLGAGDIYFIAKNLLAEEVKDA